MSDRIPRRRLRWWLYEQIDRLDNYCMKHLWMPTWIQIRVGRAWQWTFKDNITLTAVGDDSLPMWGTPSFDNGSSDAN